MSTYVEERAKALRRHLGNWARWTRTHWPELDIPEPPIFENWSPYRDGGPDAPPPPAPSMPVDESDAMRIDVLIMRLPMRHRSTIVDHWAHNVAFQREEVDAALRAMLDLMQPIDSGMARF